MSGESLATFGGLVRQHRLAAGLPQEGLAELAGLSSRGIQDLERGAVIAAARLLGAAAALRERGKAPAPTDPHYRADFERAVTLVNASLAATDIAALQHAVRDLPLDLVVAEALAAICGPGTGNPPGAGGRS